MTAGITPIVPRDQDLLEGRLSVDHRQRLETIGLLTSSLLHDLRGLVATVLMNIDGLAAQRPEDREFVEALQCLRSSTKRSLVSMDQVLMYGRRELGVQERVDLGALMKDLGRIIQGAAWRRATVTYDIDPNLPEVRAEPVQLRQVILNLVLNAIDATSTPMGVIAIAAGAGIFGRKELARLDHRDELEPGRYVWITVTDHGAGIDPSVREHLFEPFATAKKNGNGLGLYTVREIVHAHRGGIEVESERGGGTTFRVLLPATPREREGGR